MQYRLRALLPSDRRIAWILVSAAAAIALGAMVQWNVLGFGPPAEYSYATGVIFATAAVTVWLLSPSKD
jgi:hypothetical protein